MDSKLKINNNNYPCLYVNIYTKTQGRNYVDREFKRAGKSKYIYHVCRCGFTNKRQHFDSEKHWKNTMNDFYEEEDDGCDMCNGSGCMFCGPNNCEFCKKTVKDTNKHTIYTINLDNRPMCIKNIGICAECCHLPKSEVEKYENKCKFSYNCVECKTIWELTKKGIDKYHAETNKYIRRGYCML